MKISETVVKQSTKAFTRGMSVQSLFVRGHTYHVDISSGERTSTAETNDGQVERTPGQTDKILKLSGRTFEQGTNYFIPFVLFNVEKIQGKQVSQVLFVVTYDSGFSLPHVFLYFLSVHNEVQQIKLGAVFQSFEEFDRCIDSWGVINHRSVVRYKTTLDLAIWSCRFAKVVRPLSQKRTKGPGTASSEVSDSDSGVDPVGKDCTTEEDITNVSHDQHVEHEAPNGRSSGKENCNFSPHLSTQQVFFTC